MPYYAQIIPNGQDEKVDNVLPLFYLDIFMVVNKK